MTIDKLCSAENRALFTKALCFAASFLLVSCQEDYIVESESYVTSMTDCDDVSISLYKTYSNLFEQHGLFWINPMAGLPEDERPDPDVPRRVGPYQISFGFADKPFETPKKFIIQEIEIRSSLNKEYLSLVSSALPMVLEPERQVAAKPWNFENPNGWACGIQHPGNEKFQLCEYISYNIVFSELFEFQFKQNEDLFFTLDIIDGNRELSGSICFEAKPELTERETYIRIGV